MQESLAVLLLPAKLEEFELEAHARELLAIPRVVALEPSRVRPPRFMRNSASLRQARRLRFPGRVRVLVLYRPAQYPLARALLAEHAEVELWYLRAPDTAPAGDGPAARELRSLDELAQERAARVLVTDRGDGVGDAELRERLQELEVISPRAFVPEPGWGRKGPRRRR